MHASKGIIWLLAASTKATTPHLSTCYWLQHSSRCLLAVRTLRPFHIPSRTTSVLCLTATSHLAQDSQPQSAPTHRTPDTPPPLIGPAFFVGHAGKPIACPLLTTRIVDRRSSGAVERRQKGSVRRTGDSDADEAETRPTASRRLPS